MAIGDDFRVYPFSKTIRYDVATGSQTVYSVTAFYSYLMDLFDEPAYQSYEAPMKFNTPTSFSMLNGWFLDNGDGSKVLQYLTGGSINSIDYTTVGDPVFMMDVDAETQEFVLADLDEEILDDAGAVGPLLSFRANYPSAGLARFWVRDVNANGEIGVGSDITMTGPGAGDYNGNTLGPSVNGDEIYTNVFTLASFPGSPDPQVYIYQDHPVDASRIRVVEHSNLSNWDRDPNGIDILIPTTLGGTAIDGSNITTFVRQTADTFTFVESDLTGGARTPLATETLSDTANVAEAEHFLLYDSGSVGGFSVGDVIQDVSTAASDTPAAFYAEVVAIQEFTINTTGCLTLRGLRGTIADNSALFVGTTDEGTSQGTPGGTFFTYDAGTDPVAGDVGKPFTGSISGATRILRGFELFAAADGAVVLDTGTDATRFTTIDGHNLDTAALHDALYIEAVENDIWSASSGGSGTMSVTADALYSAPFLNNTIISDFTDVTISHLNGTVVTSGISGTFEIGERITYNAGAQNCIFAGWDTEFTVIQLANVDAANEPDAADIFTGQASGATVNSDSGLTDDNLLNYEFTQQSTGAVYSVLVEGGSIYFAARTLSDIYKYWQFYVRDGQSITDRVIFTSTGSAITEVAGEEYIKAVAGYTATKPAPFGTLAGTLLFGAQGVWVQGTASVDDLRLTDNAAAAQQGTPSVLVQVTNTRVSDVISVFLEDGSTGLPDKAQFGILGIEALGQVTVELDSALPVDTPAVGALFIVDDSFGQADKEHRYRYVSFSGAVVTLAAEVTGAQTGATDDIALTDSTGTPFATAERGDIIHNTSTAAIGYIVTVSGDNDVITTLMRDSTGAVIPWTNTDTYALNSIANATTGTDTAFIPYLDEIEDVGTDGTPGVVSDTLLFLGNRAVVIRVRNNLAATEIVPFVTTSDILSGGMTVAVIRTEDTVTT